MRCLFAWCALSSSLVLTVSSATRAAPMFMGLGIASTRDISSGAGDISADGSTVAGWSSSPGDEEAFRWTLASGMEPLGDLAGGAFRSSAHGVSANGQVVVGQGTSGTGAEAIRWTPGGGIESLGGYGTANDISADGTTIVGSGSFSVTNEAMRWTATEGMQGLGLLRPGDVESYARGVSGDGSVIVGSSGSGSNGHHAFRWTAATGMLEFPGMSAESESHAWAVSDDGGTVVGRVYLPEFATSEAFRWTESGGVEMLGDLPGGSFFSIGLATSADGSIVVGNANSAEGPKAFIWDPVNGLRTVEEVLNALGIDTCGWDLTGASGVSADGLTIVGAGTNPSGFQEAWIATIPEPTTALFVACGLVGLVVRARRMR